MLEQFHITWPLVLVAGGALLLLLGQKDRIVGLLARLRPARRTTGDLTPSERFDRLYALRTWCEQAGQLDAVKALDSAVLPAIVQGTSASEGGSQP